MSSKERDSFELDSCSDLDDLNAVTAINLYNQKCPISKDPQPAKDYSRELSSILFNEPKCSYFINKIDNNFQREEVNIQETCKFYTKHNGSNCSYISNKKQHFSRMFTLYYRS